MPDLAIRRTAAGLSQEALAHRIGKHSGSIRRYEAGARIPETVALQIEAALEDRPSLKLHQPPCPCPLVVEGLEDSIRRHMETAIRAIRILAECATVAGTAQGYAREQLRAKADELQKSAGHAERLWRK